MKRAVWIFAVLFVPITAFSQKGEISAPELKRHIEFLASDSLKGRKPGTPEINVAAGYILGVFRQAGLKPLADNGFQWFDIVTDARLGERNRLVYDGIEAVAGKDFAPLAFTANASLSAPVVFAGYGFDIDADSLKWSDYRGIDVTGKWVMVLRADPELDKPDSRFIPYSDVRTKVLTAKDKGAAGILLVTPAGLDKEDKLMPLVVENNEITGGIPVISITRKLADRLLEKTGILLDSLDRTIIALKNPHSLSTGVTLDGTAHVEQRQDKTANVVALLEGSDPALKNEYLVVGAHYDHLGFGGPSSGSRMPDTTAIHNGADDNASGTALVMELAARLAKEKPALRRSILFVAFSAEEMGLLGSKYFVEHSPVALKQIKAMFNFDMVGRFDREKNSISVSGTGTSAESDSLLRILEKELPFSVVHAPDGYGPSDHAAFYAAGIPVFYFNTGVHTDYHTPFDDTGKIDVESESRVGDYAASVIVAVDRLPGALAFRESGKKEQAGRTGRKLKVTLGIMPDFAGSEKKGLRVDGVTKDGPAWKGGMKKGDVITAINGLKVENIYEYMSRLQKLKHGTTASVEVIRDGKNEVLLIQL